MPIVLFLVQLAIFDLPIIMLMWRWINVRHATRNTLFVLYTVFCKLISQLRPHNNRLCHSYVPVSI
jgi:hypothetical protein